MAKKSKRRPMRVSKIATTRSNDRDETQHFHASTVIHPSLSTTTPHKRRCHLAHAKHTTQPAPPSTPTKPTLGTRFHALPPELRAEIFSHLLVRPVKWQLPHHPTCPLTTSPTSIYPNIHNLHNATCVRCFQHNHYHHRLPLWRAHQDQDLRVAAWNLRSAGLGHVTWQNPWRSHYAPPVQNSYLCSECWDLLFRPRPHPAQDEVGGQRHLRCLCARRQNLDVLLVCRLWQEEAGAVFYSQNTFAFESAAVFAAFVLSLPQKWREKVTRVSIVAYHPPAPDGASGWEGNRKLSRVWGLLQRLPRLAYLELDARFLSRAKTAQRLLRLTLRNVRRVCFVARNFGRGSRASEWVWPEYRDARLIVGGFAEEVARAIKGQRPRRGLWRTGRDAIRLASQREEGMEAHVMALDAEACRSGMGGGNIYHSVSATAYTRLWWEEQRRFASGSGAHCDRLNGLHAYLPTEYTHFNSIRVETREEHWREWRQRTSLRSEDFGIRNLGAWREAAGWEVLFRIQAEEFLDETQKEWRGWEFLSGIET